MGERRSPASKHPPEPAHPRTCGIGSTASASSYHLSYGRIRNGRMALVPRRPEVRASPGSLPSRGRWQMERHRARAGHGGVVTRSYVTNLRKGRIDNPGMDKLAVIAKA